MNYLNLFVGCLLVVTARAQFEKGYVKILEDQRYQDGANFGNFRNQEDGIKYKEETNALGVRSGFWEYPGENGQLVRVEFEAGPGIGFRILNSNIADPTPLAPKTDQTQQVRAQPQHQPQPKPAPRVHAESVVRAQPQPQQHQPVFRAQPQPQQHQPVFRAQPQPQQHQPVFRAQPQPQQHQPVFRAQPQPQHQPLVQLPQPQPRPQPQPQAFPIPIARQPNNLVIAREPSPVTPAPVNLFDYPADLQFFRDAGGHRFKFTAV